MNVNCTNNTGISGATVFSGMQNSLSDVCIKLKNYQDGIHRCPEPNEFMTTHWKFGYSHLEYADSQTLRFRCLDYYRLDTGHLVWNCLPNGTWSGAQPVCAPVSKRNKWDVMKEIVFTSLGIALVLLLIDFMLWKIRKFKKRDERRQKMLSIAASCEADFPPKPLSKIESSVDARRRVHSSFRVAQPGSLRNSMRLSFTSKTSFESSEPVVRPKQFFGGSPGGPGVQAGPSRPTLINAPESAVQLADDLPRRAMASFLATRPTRWLTGKRESLVSRSSSEKPDSGTSVW
ncbi:hypothetical protein EGW08_000495 [Elysia chlorotica]|uniref:Sushi domain-containing protein n=1 Tax=Elysia chlorotica TaxID=188477 RepID=A0A433UD34_ELYCH|nr:hypothetical protein EGW08_000495 [Elysia chlorotica]